jgi:uncharacterized membrane protein YhiD involved in acid resistance
MDHGLEQLLQVALAPDPALPWQTVAFCLLMSFVLTTVQAQVYIWTHRGLSYSRSFVHTLILGSVVSATLMTAVGNNLARGVGILGTLAIIRFRSTVKDPRDMVHVFAALSTGIAMGVRSYGAGVMGTVIFSLVSFALHASAFGARVRYDGLLRFVLAAHPDNDLRLRNLLDRHCARFVLVSLREVEQGQRAEHNYHVKLRDPYSQALFVQELMALPGVRGVSFYLNDATEEA